MSDKAASQLISQGNDKATEILSLLASSTLGEAMLSPEGKQAAALVEDYNEAYSQILAFNITQKLGSKLGEKVRDIRNRARSINPMLDKPLDVDLLKKMYIDAVKKEREQLLEKQKERHSLVNKALIEKNEKIASLNAKSKQLAKLQSEFKDEIKAFVDELAVEGVVLDVSLNTETRDLSFVDHLKDTGKKVVYQYNTTRKTTKIQDPEKGEVRIAYEAFHFCDCI